MDVWSSDPVVFFSGNASNFLRQIPPKRMNENEQVTVIIPIISNVTCLEKNLVSGIKDICYGWVGKCTTSYSIIISTGKVCAIVSHVKSFIRIT